MILLDLLFEPSSDDNGVREMVHTIVSNRQERRSKRCELDSQTLRRYRANRLFPYFAVDLKIRPST